jgi:hypothetical protein
MKTFLIISFVLLIFVSIGLHNDLPKHEEIYSLTISNFTNAESIFTAHRFQADDDKRYLIKIPKDININQNFIRNDSLWCEGIFHKVSLKNGNFKGEYFEFTTAIEPPIPLP